jgi:hypothetical protein
MCHVGRSHLSTVARVPANRPANLRGVLLTLPCCFRFHVFERPALPTVAPRQRARHDIGHATVLNVHVSVARPHVWQLRHGYSRSPIVVSLASASSGPDSSDSHAGALSPSTATTSALSAVPVRSAR